MTLLLLKFDVFWTERIGTRILLEQYLEKRASRNRKKWKVEIAGDDETITSLSKNAFLGDLNSLVVSTSYEKFSYFYSKQTIYERIATFERMVNEYYSNLRYSCNVRHAEECSNKDGISQWHSQVRLRFLYSRNCPTTSNLNRTRRNNCTRCRTNPNFPNNGRSCLTSFPNLCELT